MLRYAITNLTEAVPGPGPEAAKARRRRWLQDLRRWTDEGIDFVQLREKDMAATEAAELLRCARQGFDGMDAGAGAKRPRLLLNGSPAMAQAAGADGVHLPSKAAASGLAGARTLARQAEGTSWFVSVSCHTLEEVVAARSGAADLILFGPVFGKTIKGQMVTPGTGLELLRAACMAAGDVAVLALGGVTEERAVLCREQGAAGVAAIRLFAGP